MWFANILIPRRECAEALPMGSNWFLFTIIMSLDNENWGFKNTGDETTFFYVKNLYCAGGLDGISKLSFKFLYTLWVYRLCINLLHIYVSKNCHRQFYGFENLMSSWGVWIWSSKLVCGNVFLKNHAKRKMFQINWRPQAFLVKIWCQVRELGYDSHKRS